MSAKEDIKNLNEDTLSFLKSDWCPYEVNCFEKNGICNLCGLPKSVHTTKRKYNELRKEYGISK